MVKGDLIGVTSYSLLLDEKRLGRLEPADLGTCLATSLNKSKKQALVVTE